MTPAEQKAAEAKLKEEIRLKEEAKTTIQLTPREVDLSDYEGEIIDELLKARSVLPVGTTGDQIRETVPVFLRVTKIVLDRHK